MLARNTSSKTVPTKKQGLWHTGLGGRVGLSVEVKGEWQGSKAYRQMHLCRSHFIPLNCMFHDNFRASIK